MITAVSVKNVGEQFDHNPTQYIGGDEQKHLAFFDFLADMAKYNQEIAIFSHN